MREVPAVLRLGSAKVWLALAGFLLVFYAPLLAGKVLVDRDLFRLFIPDAHFLKRCLQLGEWPLWNPFQRLGQPFAATMQSQVYYPPHLILVALFEPARAVTAQVALHVALLAVSVYVLLRSYGHHTVAACLGAAAAAFTPLLSQMTSQLNILSALAWTGFQLLALRQLVAAPSARRLAIVSLLFGASLFAGSPEVLLMQLLLAVLLVAFEPGTKKPLALAALPLALLLGAVVLLPAAELALNSTRAGGVINGAQWSASFGDLGALAVISTPGVPRKDFLPTTTMGVGLIWLVIVALFTLRKTRAAWPFAIAAAVLLLLSLGENFAPSALFLKLPPFSLFRYPSRYLLGAAFALAVLAGFGAQAVLQLPRKQVILPLLAVAALQAVTLRGGAQLVWALVFTAMIAFAALLGGALKAVAAVCALELIAARVYLRAPGWRPLQTVAGPSELNALVDHSEGARISVELEHVESTFAPDDLIEKSRDALYPLRWVEEGLEAVEGYGAPEPRRVTLLTQTFQLPRVLYDLASVRSYVRAGPPPFEGLSRAPQKEGLPTVYLSTTALPRAFIVQRARIANDGEAAALLSEERFDAKTIALLAPGATALDGEPCVSTVTRERVSARLQRYAFNACADGYLIVGDAEFPGWGATLDGEDAEIARANLLFRAVRVPAGSHTVELRYSPWTSRVGALLSLLTLTLLIAALARKPR